jgi:two-component system sensor histidine kinase TctE
MVRSLRSHLLRRMLWPMLSVGVAGGIIAYILALDFSAEAYDAALLDNARSLAREIISVQGRANLVLTQQASDMLQWDPQDQLEYRVDTERDGLIAGNAKLPQAYLGGRSQAFAYGNLQGKEVRLITIAEPFGDQLVKITVTETLNKRTRLARKILFTVLSIELLIIGLFVLSVRSGIRRGLAPIGELEQWAHLRSSDDFTPLPEARVPDEIQPFTNAINNLLTRLGKTMLAQKHLIADASHQLRTPLAAIKVQIEYALRESDPARHAEALQQALASLDRTTRLSSQLLLMAKVESGIANRKNVATVDLGRVAIESGSLWVPLAIKQHADLGFEGPDASVWVKGDAILIGEAVNNLIDNALRYAGPHARVTLSVEPPTAASGPVLSVEDSGKGIPESEREAVFERFHRVPGSPGTGSGLGLSIVQEIARMHGATVVAGNSSLGGIRFSLVFPFAPG